MKKGDDLVTRNDLEKFGARLEKKLEQKLEQKLGLKLAQQSVYLETSIRNSILQEIRDFEQKISEWKSEIFRLVDGLAGEVRDNREHRQITSYQISNNTERIGKLEKKVFGVVTQA
jgi:hypothetical protein